MDYNDEEFKNRMQELEDWLVERELRRDIHHISACDGCETECDICPYFECVGCKLGG